MRFPEQVPPRLPGRHAEDPGALNGPLARPVPWPDGPAVDPHAPPARQPLRVSETLLRGVWGYVARGCCTGSQKPHPAWCSGEKAAPGEKASSQMGTKPCRQGRPTPPAGGAEDGSSDGTSASRGSSFLVSKTCGLLASQRPGALHARSWT